MPRYLRKARQNTVLEDVVVAVVPSTGSPTSNTIACVRAQYFPQPTDNADDGTATNGTSIATISSGLNSIAQICNNVVNIIGI